MILGLLGINKIHSQKKETKNIFLTFRCLSLSAYFSASLTMFSISSLLSPPDDWITTEKPAKSLRHQSLKQKESNKKPKPKVDIQRTALKTKNLLCCSLPVPLSLAETLTMPLASISNVTSTWGTPRGAGGMPTYRRIIQSVTLRNLRPHW